MAGFFEALRAEVKTAGVSVTVAYPGVVERIALAALKDDVRP